MLVYHLVRAIYTTTNYLPAPPRVLEPRGLPFASGEWPSAQSLRPASCAVHVVHCSNVTLALNALQVSIERERHRYALAEGERQPVGLPERAMSLS